MEPFAMCLLGAGIMFFGVLMGVVLGRTTTASQAVDGIKRSMSRGASGIPVPEEEE